MYSNYPLKYVQSLLIKFTINTHQKSKFIIKKLNTNNVQYKRRSVDKSSNATYIIIITTGIYTIYMFMDFH